MKQLQNDFTTPEQSKRLLELGVPADSADCFYDKHFFGGTIVQTRMGADWRKSHKLFSGVFEDVITPCWSVGRLFEIIGICAGMECVDFETLAWAQGTWVEKLIILLQDLVKYDKMDFSKLEE